MFHAAFAPEFCGSLVVDGSDEVDGEVTEDGHVVCAMSLSQSRVDVLEGDVECPVQGVLDQLMVASRLGRPLGVEIAGRDVVAGLRWRKMVQKRPATRLLEAFRGDGGQGKPSETGSPPWKHPIRNSETALTRIRGSGTRAETFERAPCLMDASVGRMCINATSRGDL